MWQLWERWRPAQSSPVTNTNTDNDDTSGRDYPWNSLIVVLELNLNYSRVSHRFSQKISSHPNHKAMMWSNTVNICWYLRSFHQIVNSNLLTVALKLICSSWTKIVLRSRNHRMSTIEKRPVRFFPSRVSISQKTRWVCPGPNITLSTTLVTLLRTVLAQALLMTEPGAGRWCWHQSRRN